MSVGILHTVENDGQSETDLAHLLCAGVFDSHEVGFQDFSLEYVCW